MKDLYRKLLGELIGLARATDGSEHLITPDSTAVILECLAASEADDDTFARLLARVEEVKRQMVPNCFCCANPCGRTSAFDLSELALQPEPVRAAKDQILQRLMKADASVGEASLYRGLIALGMEDLTPAFLQSIAEELSV